MKAFCYLLLGLFASLSASADIWWSGTAGGGDGVNWNDPRNWSGGEVPTSSDVVYLGYADGGNVADVAQNIVIDADASVSRLFIYAADNRSVSLTSENNATLSIAFTGNVSNRALDMQSTAGSDVLIDVPILTDHTTFWFSNQSTDYSLIIGPNSTVNKKLESAGAGGYVFQGAWNAGDYRSRDGVPVVLDGGTLGVTSFDKPPSIHVKSDSVLGGFRGAATGASSLQRVANGPLELTIGYMATATSANIPNSDWSSVSPLNIIPSEDDNGPLTIRISQFRLLSSGIDTDADTTVQFYSNSAPASRTMEFGSVGITGSGNVHLLMDDASHTFTIKRPNEYTGKTIIERGILVMGSHQVTGDQRTGSGTYGNAEDTPLNGSGGATYNPNLPYGYELGTYYGSLPSVSVVEIGEQGTLRLNANVPQTIGGLNDYQGTGGTVELNGATLTINSVTDTAFSGNIVGAGSIVKSGAFAFSLNGAISYTGAFTVAGGTFNVNTALTGNTISVQDGGILGGGGSIGGAVTIGSGGALAPGNSSGTLSFAGNLIFEDNATVHFELGSGDSDLIVLNGIGQTLATSGDLLWLFTVNGDVMLNQSYRLIDWIDAGDLDTFDFLLSDMVIANPGLEGYFSLGEYGLSVTFSAVPIPEPAHIALAIAALCGIFAMRRRSRMN